MFSKPKQQREERNWLELPSDLMLNILQRLGVSNRLLNAQKVCTAWREICKDPAIWRVVYVNTVPREMCKLAVDRSQGQLVDLTLVYIYDDDDEILQYVADRSSQLRRLELVYFYDKKLGETLKKLPLLEELSLVRTNITKGEIEAVGRFCPLLKTLKVNQKASYSQHEIAVAIAENLPELTHLELIGNRMTNIGLQAILDGCCHLESLDLRGCGNLDLKGELGKRCSQQIKHLKLPHDSLVGYPHACRLFSL